MICKKQLNTSLMKRIGSWASVILLFSYNQIEMWMHSLKSINVCLSHTYMHAHIHTSWIQNLKTSLLVPALSYTKKSYFSCYFCKISLHLHSTFFYRHHLWFLWENITDTSLIRISLSSKFIFHKGNLVKRFFPLFLHVTFHSETLIYFSTSLKLSFSLVQMKLNS